MVQKKHNVIPTFVVSLRRATDRREAFTSQAAKFGLSFEFFDAIDAKQEEKAAMDAMQNADQVFKNIGRILSYPEVACGRSHQLLYELCVSKNLNGMLIFEDDIELTNSILPFLSFVYKNSEILATENCVFHLGGLEGFEHRTLILGERSAKEIDKNTKLKKVMLSHNAVQRTCGYYVTNSAAKSILKNEPLICHVPDPWSFRLDNDTLDSVWMLTPCAVKHPTDLSGSELEGERAALEGKKKSVDMRPWWHRLVARARAHVTNAVRRWIYYPILKRIG